MCRKKAGARNAATPAPKQVVSYIQAPPPGVTNENKPVSSNVDLDQTFDTTECSANSAAGDGSGKKKILREVVHPDGTKTVTITEVEEA